MILDLQRLKAERIAKGYSQESLARKLKWNRNQYGKRERGDVPIGADELARIVNALGFSEGEIGIFFKSNVPERKRF